MMTLLLTTLPETPGPRGTLSRYPEWSATLVIQCLGTGQTTAALVQGVVSGLTAGRGLTGGDAT